MNASSTSTVRVWDLGVRAMHWTLVAACFTAWYWTEHIGTLHHVAGYVALGVVVLRTAWGFLGRDHARFADFVRSPRAVARYTWSVATGREPRYLGHNPLGGLMVLYLLVAVAFIAVTGWMMTLDAFWGNDTVELLHTLAVDTTVWAVLIHVAANVFASVRHKENLVVSMFTGRKPAASPHAACDRHP